MLKNKINKLFFGKWPYKIELKIKGASIISKRGIDFTKAWCLNDRRQPITGMYADVDPVSLYRFVLQLEPFLENQHQSRAESRSFYYYTDDESVIDEMNKVFKDNVVGVWGPQTKEELDFLTVSKKKVLCDTLPYSKYHYKVILKTSIPTANKASFWQWISQYGEEEVKMADATTRWLTGRKPWIETPFFYLKDSKLLMLAGIYLSNHILRVDEYIPRYTIICNK